MIINSISGGELCDGNMYCLKQLLCSICPFFKGQLDIRSSSHYKISIVLFKSNSIRLCSEIFVVESSAMIFPKRNAGL